MPGTSPGYFTLFVQFDILHQDLVTNLIEMTKILISGCLLGQKVRYNGEGKLQQHQKLQEWIQAGKVISICPEVAGGLPIPRPPAEIQPGNTGIDVLNYSAPVFINTGTDVTTEFIQGAQKTLELAQKHGVKVAILKARSPSCGSSQIYDGSFTGNIVEGMGVTTALLTQHGIQVFNEDQINQALLAAESTNT